MWKDSSTIRKKPRQVHFFSVLFCLIMVFISTTQVVQAEKKMYRWIDEKGNVFVSDRVPPNQVKYKRESLNKNARIIETVEKEKTRDQRELAKRLAKLRQQQEKIIQKQKTHDKVLLSTYRTIDDMRIALKGKMLAFDRERHIVSGSIEHLEKQLKRQQKQAAQFERDGLKVPKIWVEKIAASKSQIKQGLLEFARLLDKKKQFQESFKADIGRFTFLSKSDATNIKQNQVAETKAANELGLFFCESVEQCDRAWKAAETFVESHSMTPLNITSNTLIMSSLPTRNAELSLSVSRLNMKGNKQQLFLDIQCYDSFRGKALCNGKKTKNIRQSFNVYIKSALQSPLTSE